MRRILDVVKAKVGIYCSTLDESKEYSKIAREQGLSHTQWQYISNETVYYPHECLIRCSGKIESETDVISFKELKERLEGNSTKKEMKIDIPKGYEFDCVENGKIKLKEVKKEFPKTYEECLCVLNERGNKPYYIGSSGEVERGRNFQCEKDFPARRLATSVRALQMLLTAREVYRDGWRPAWKEGDWKYIIRTDSSDITNVNNLQSFFLNVVLSFQSKEVTDEFYKNFKDLIEEAKELL